MVANLFPQAKVRFFNQAGTAPLAGGKVYFYAAGTTTPKTTYTTSAATVPNSNPVILDAYGEANIWLDGAYKITLTDANDVLQWTVDNYEVNYPPGDGTVTADKIDTGDAAAIRSALGLGSIATQDDDSLVLDTQLKISGATVARATLEELDAGTNEKVWPVVASGGKFIIGTAVDGSQSVVKRALEIGRSGSNVGDITFESTAGNFYVNGGANVFISNANPIFTLHENNGAADEQYWRTDVNAGDLRIATRTDASDAAVTNAWYVGRLGTGISGQTWTITSSTFNFSGGIVNATSGVNPNSSGGTALTKYLRASASLNFGSIAAAASATLTIACTGAAVNDIVSLGAPNPPTAGILYDAYVSAAGTVTVRATNITAAPIDPAAQTWAVEVC